MNQNWFLRRGLLRWGSGKMLAVALAAPLFAGCLLAAPPEIGGKAPDFALASTTGAKVRLSDIHASNIVLVVLRGYPGYQCPFCTRQVQDFVRHDKEFARVGAEVVFIYPGPPAELDTHASEFLNQKQLPAHFQMLLDPGYEFTNLYDLRWNGAQETAYPSTFLLDSQGKVYFAKISREHGNRTSAKEILEVLGKKPVESSR